MGRAKFDVKLLGLSRSCEVKASARLCASSLSDKPTGTGVTGGKIGERIGGKKDRWRRTRKVTVSAPGSSVTNICCPFVIPESQVASGLNPGFRPR